MTQKLKSAYLHSNRYLYDNNCTAYFNKKKVYTINNDSIILQDFRDNSNGRWKVLVPLKQNISNFIQLPAK